MLLRLPPRQRRPAWGRDGTPRGQGPRVALLAGRRGLASRRCGSFARVPGPLQGPTAASAGVSSPSPGGGGGAAPASPAVGRAAPVRAEPGAPARGAAPAGWRAAPWEPRPPREATPAPATRPGRPPPPGGQAAARPRLWPAGAYGPAGRCTWRARAAGPPGQPAGAGPPLPRDDFNARCGRVYSLSIR